MPSPFPGMDPYLEDPAIWPDFHHRLAHEASSALNAVLPRPYYARLESRPEVGIAGGGGGRTIVPDVSVVRLSRGPDLRGPRPGSIVVAERRPRAEPTESLRVADPDERLRHHFVEIRDPSRGHALVTLIEIVSPSNKRKGPDREAYLAKQREVLDGDTNLIEIDDTNLIEIDLLSSGTSVAASPGVRSSLKASPRGRRYLVAVSRSWERSPSPDYELYPFGLADPLPCVRVPLREGEPEVLLDLQYVLDRAYETGPYLLGAVDYTQHPRLRLTNDERGWVRDRVAAAFPELFASPPESDPPLPGERGQG